MCLTLVWASFLTKLSGLSFRYGIIGSMRTAVGTPFFARVSTHFRRSEGGGAYCSMSFAVLSSSVVIVRETIEGILARRSASLVTMLDFVIIWILQSCLDRISRHFRIKPVSASTVGYGSEELEIEIISPLSVAASLPILGIKSFLGLQSENCGM